MSIVVFAKESLDVKRQIRKTRDLKTPLNLKPGVSFAGSPAQSTVCNDSAGVRVNLQLFLNQQIAQSESRALEKMKVHGIRGGFPSKVPLFGPYWLSRYPAGMPKPGRP